MILFLGVIKETNDYRKTLNRLKKNLVNNAYIWKTYYLPFIREKMFSFYIYLYNHLKNTTS